MSYAGDLDPAQAWELLARDPDAVLVDVRTDAEWTFVGLPDVSELGKKVVLVQWNLWPGGARNDGFVEQLRDAGVDGSGPVVFICRSGQRSIGAAEAATAAGLTPSYNVSEGFEGDLGPDGRRDVTGWRVRGLPWRQA